MGTMSRHREVIELHGRESCHYQLANPWNQPLGRIEAFLRPILLDPQSYVVEPGARLVSSNLVGVDRRRRIVEETLHLKEIDGRLRRELRLRSLLPPQERLAGAVCSLVDSRQWSDSYYHWFLDCLPRLIAAEHHSQRHGEHPRVIVPAILKPWQEQSLNLLGIAPARRISHRPVGRGGLRVDRLIASVAHRWQRRGDAPFDAASPWALQQLAARLSEGTPLPATAAPRRIYLSRRGVPTRRVVNEEAVLALLEPHGFVAVQSEQLSLVEQIALFRGATHIVAPHGASLTNLLHARGSSVLELFQEGHGVRPDFFQLAMINDLNYHHALCPSSGAAMHCVIPTQVIEDFLALTL
jgi:capsular polysaccharide biosynthesis protein